MACGARRARHGARPRRGSRRSKRSRRPICWPCSTCAAVPRSFVSRLERLIDGRIAAERGPVVCAAGAGALSRRRSCAGCTARRHGIAREALPDALRRRRALAQRAARVLAGRAAAKRAADDLDLSRRRAGSSSQGDHAARRRPGPRSAAATSRRWRCSSAMRPGCKRRSRCSMGSAPRPPRPRAPGGCARSVCAAFDAGATAARAHDPHGLTARERKSSSCWRERLSNRAIANELHRSERTVEHHVSALLAKLGVASRSELATRGRKNRWR